MTAKWKEISAYTGRPVDEDAPTNFAGAGSGVDFNLDNASSFAIASAYKSEIAILSQSIFFSSSFINYRNTLTNSSSFTMPL